jgi:hypothetical protein
MLLTQAPAGTSLAVVAPVPLDGGGADSGGALAGFHDASLKDRPGGMFLQHGAHLTF